MAKTKNITKKMVLEAIKTAADGMDFGDVVTAEDVIAYVDTTIVQLDAKAAKAQERAAKTKAEGDILSKIVAEQITDEFQTVNEITKKVNSIEGYEGVTSAKIIARLTQLVKKGEIFKTSIKAEDGRKLMAYSTSNNIAK